MSNFLVYLSGGPNRQHFKNPETGQPFTNKKHAQDYILQFDPTVVFSNGARKELNYVIYPDGQPGASPSSLKYQTPSVSLSEFISILTKRKTSMKKKTPSAKKKRTSGTRRVHFEDGSGSDDEIHSILLSMKTLKLDVQEQQTKYQKLCNELDKLQHQLNKLTSSRR